MALEIGKDKTVYAINTVDGYMAIKAKAIILSMGCRERTRGAIGIPGDRPSGVLTAGAAQRYINMEGYMPGKEVVILGSGDIGLIMARRMSLEGADSGNGHCEDAASFNCRFYRLWKIRLHQYPDYEYPL